MNVYDLTITTNNSKKEILNALCDCMLLVSENANQITKQYNPELLKLLTTLAENQNDNAFLTCEGSAIGKYFKSKGCSKQEIELITNSIMNYFD